MKTAVLVVLSLFALMMLVTLVFKDELTDKPPWTEIPAATTPHGTLALDDDAFSRDRFGAIASLLVAFGGINGPGLVMLVLAGDRARRASRHADRDSEAAATGNSIVSGDVEAVDEDPSPVIEVRVRQAGSQRNFRGTTFHSWKEIERKITVRPFGVRTKDGSLVRVETTKTPVVDIPLPELVVPVPESGARIGERVRRGSITSGSRIHVRGVRRSGATAGGDSVYREHSDGPSISEPSDEPIIISTDPLHRRASEAGRSYAIFMAVVGVVLVLTNLIFMRKYDLLLIDGETVQAPLDGRRAWKEWVVPKHGSPHEVTRTELRALAELSNGERVPVWGACSNEFYDAVLRGSYDAVPVVVSKHFPGTYQLGLHAGVSLGASAAALGLLTVVWVLLWIALKGLRPAEPGAPINDEATGPLDVFTNLKRPF